jgi:predicted nucleic acid-binding Zn finger protein
MTERFRRGVRAMLSQFEFLPAGNHVYYVTNAKNRETYDVTETTCSCPDFSRRCATEGGHCKHIVALKLHRNKLRYYSRVLGVG